MIGFTLKNLFDNTLLVVKLTFGWCLFLPVLIICFVPFYILKTFVIYFTRIVHPDFRPISKTDAVFTADSFVQDENLETGRKSVLSNIGACLEMEESSNEMDRTLFAQHLEKTLLQNKDLLEYSWKLKFHLVRFCGYTFRKETSNFSIFNHVKKVDLAPGENLLEYLNNWITNPYDTPDMPPWEFLILKSNSKEYIAYKIHHSIADGLTLLQLSSIVFHSETPHLIQPVAGRSIPRIPQLDKVRFYLRLPLLIGSKMLMMKRARDPLKFNSCSGGTKKQLSSTQTLSLTNLKQISKKHGTRVQSALLAIYGGAIRRYLKNTGRTIPDFIILPIPQLMPNRPKFLIGNRFNTIYVPVSLSQRSTQERIKDIESKILEIYSTKMFLIHTNVMESLFSLFPLKLMRYIMSSDTPIRFSLSPLLFPDRCSYQTRKATPMFPIFGITTPAMGILSLLFSSQDKVLWTIVGARDLFNTQEQLDIFTKKYLMEEFDELLASGEPVERRGEAIISLQ